MALQRTAGNRATAQLVARARQHPPPAVARPSAPNARASARVPQRQLARKKADDENELEEPTPAGAAGGCGLCYGEQYPGAIGPRDAGTVAHDIIQDAMVRQYPGMQHELHIPGRSGTGYLDLAREVPPNTLEIGEIKPQDSIEEGIKDIDWYLKIIPQTKQYKGWNVRPLELRCPQPLSFPTLSVDCPQQSLWIANTKGLYMYFCSPSFKELKASGCKCKKRRRGDKDPPVIVDRLDKSKGKGADKGADKGKRIDGDKERIRPPVWEIPQEIDWARVLRNVGIAAAVIAVVVGIIILLPAEILAAIAAALGLAVASLLAFLGLTWGSGEARADPRPGGTKVDPSAPPQPVPSKPVPSNKGPVVKSPQPAPAPGKKTPAPGPAPQPTNGKPAVGPKAPPAKKRTTTAVPKKLPVNAGNKRKAPTRWATVEGWRADTAWLNQELWVWDGDKGSGARTWMLRVVKIEKTAAGTQVTFESFLETQAGKQLEAGNRYTVTHPYRGQPEGPQPQSVVAVIQEPAGLRDKLPQLKSSSGKVAGLGAMLGLLMQIARPRAQAGAGSTDLHQ